jgi:hypothetical protein
MVDFKKLLEKPLMTEEEYDRLHDKLWKDWYDGLSESDKKIVDNERKRL